MTEYIFKVERLSHEGRGIAHYGTEQQHPEVKHGKKVFIRYALPNEIVKAEITHIAKRLEEAESVAVIAETSPHRVEPFCQYFGRCGGCSLQHLALDEQVKFKQETLSSHLQHFADIQTTQWLEPIRSQGQHYRRRARIGVRYLPKSKQLLFGFRENQSNRLVDIEQCQILESELNQQLQPLKHCLQSLQAKADIGHIELAKGENAVALLIRQTAKFNNADIQKLLDFVEKLGWQLYLQAPQQQYITRIDDGLNLKNSADLSYDFADFDLKLMFSPTDFTQVNHQVNQKMVKQACELLDLKQGESVLDLFCGLGNFSLVLAKLVGETGRVVGVEGSKSMVERATENAKLNGLQHRTRFFTQDLTQDFSKKSWAKQGFDAILIDPPRSGAIEVMRYLAHFNAKRIVYVSCDPATLARDSRVLLDHGYTLSKVGVMDMFSHTEHIESMALFERIDVNEQKCD